MPNCRRQIIIFSVFFTFAFGLVLPGALWGQTGKAGKEGTVKPEASQPAAEAKKDLQPTKLDRAGEKISDGIDRFGQKAASRFGGWINAEILAGITWMKLLFCLLLLFVVAVTERLTQAVIRRHQGDPAIDMETAPIRVLVLEALSRPLSLFIWVYGIYAVLAPLFVNFRQPDGTNLIHLVVQKAADVGAAIAIIWFIMRLVAIVDVHLKKWAASTESTTDDLLVPLVGKKFVWKSCGVLRRKVLILRSRPARFTWPTTTNAS